MTTRKRILLGAFGDPGHVFPILALSEELVSRGHTVAIETARHWQASVESVGAELIAAPEFQVFPTDAKPLQPYQAVVKAVNESRPRIEEFSPDLVVHDVLTIAPALAAELIDIPRVTIIPHVYPVNTPGSPPYGIGGHPPRSALGRLLWKSLSRPISRGLSLGQRQYDELRKQVGLEPRGELYGSHSDLLVIVATLPQLEYPRIWPDHVHVTGPLFWEPEAADVPLPAGDRPLVMIAPSTAQDPKHQMLRAAIEGLESDQFRVIATWNRRPIDNPPVTPANTELVEWLSYSRTMPKCAAVVSNGGHGTIARTLQAGAVPVVVPIAGDQFENAARVEAGDLGIRLPTSLLSPKTLRLAVERALSSDRFSSSVAGAAKWCNEHDGRANAADLIESTFA